MVYRGKPSRGCQICRERKIRCDRLPDGCTNCLKAGRQCPGYRDELDLMFQDESQDVERKAKDKGKGKGKGASSSKGSTPPSVTPGSSSGTEQAISLPRPRGGTSPLPLTRTHTPFPTLDERAMGFFFTHYALGADGPSIWRADDPANIWVSSMTETLQTSSKALGLAGLANSAHSSDLMHEAKKQYVAAIQATNLALSSSAEVKKDSTLLAVILLSVVEAIIGADQRSLEAWAAHVNGAAALVKLRGVEQLNTLVGLRMFLQATATVMTTCLQHGLEMPGYVLELRAEAAENLDPNDPSTRFHEAMMLFTNFRARARRGGITDPRVILTSALELDQRALSIFAQARPDWAYRVVYTDEDPDMVFGGCYHVYDHSMAAQIWNGMRSMRILLHEMIRDVLLAGFSGRPPLFNGPEHTAQYQTSTEILYQMQREILASVPQYLGYTSRTRTPTVASSSTAPPPTSTEASGPTFLWSAFRNKLHSPFRNTGGAQYNLPVIRTSGGYTLPWALYLAGATDIATDPIRRWVIEKLEAVGRFGGVRQAIVLADRLEQRARPALGA